MFQDVEVTIKFNENEDLIQESKILRDKPVISHRITKVDGDELVQIQSCNGKVGKRFFKRQ